MLAILVGGAVCHLRYEAPWSGTAGGAGLTLLKDAWNRVLAPAASRVLANSADAADVEGIGNLVEGVQNAVLGSTGGDYVFPEAFYPHRALLTQDQQFVYNQAYANALEANQEAFLLVRPLTEEALIRVMNALLNDQPQLFYLEPRYSYSYLADGMVVSLQLAYNALAGDLEKHRSAFSTAAEEILKGARELATLPERERYVHDALLSRVAYDENAVYNQSAYSAMVMGSSVCAGYARALQYLLMELGIPCYYCEGTVDGGNHAWNIVALSEGYYHVDPSWNDVMGNEISYAYFNLTDGELSADHARRGLALELPPCNATRYHRDNLIEKAAPQATQEIPSYQSLGFSHGDVITSLSGYYRAMEEYLISRGKGEHTLELVIDGTELLNRIYRSVKDQEYVEGYAQAVAEGLNLINCKFSLSLSAEYLQDGYVLLTQVTGITGDPKPSPSPTPTPTPLPTPTPTDTLIWVPAEGPVFATAQPQETPTPQESFIPTGTPQQPETPQVTESPLPTPVETASPEPELPAFATAEPQQIAP